jgi:hypothetical protein
MFSTANLNDALRAVSSSLQIPVICVLLVMIAVVIIMAGTLLAETFTERLRLKPGCLCLWIKYKNVKRTSRKQSAAAAF